MKIIKLMSLSFILVVSVILVACGNGNVMPELDSEIALTIRQDYIVASVRQDANVVDEVIIHVYYGTFNNSVVLALSGMDSILIDQYGGSETIAGKTFSYTQIGFQILVWNDGSFFTLTDAHTQNLLTDDNIVKIWNLHQK
ncbi:MAG: hypothetical protein FWC80_01760 [Firmicutes bacterium]|nr:hypothetical protein [Bacillota bacterium]